MTFSFDANQDNEKQLIAVMIKHVFQKNTFLV